MIRFTTGLDVIIMALWNYTAIFFRSVVEMSKIFVYGSLMKNWPYNQYYMQGQTFLGNARIEGFRKYIFGGLHGIYPEPGAETPGEVYEIDARVLAKLDFLHNQGTVYSRKMVDVMLENGETIAAETYIWNG